MIAFRVVSSDSRYLPGDSYSLQSAIHKVQRPGDLDEGLGRTERIGRDSLHRADGPRLNNDTGLLSAL
jgi:hypothetical protein